MGETKERLFPTFWETNRDDSLTEHAKHLPPNGQRNTRETRLQRRRNVAKQQCDQRSQHVRQAGQESGVGNVEAEHFVQEFRHRRQHERLAPIVAEMDNEKCPERHTFGHRPQRWPPAAIAGLRHVVHALLDVVALRGPDTRMDGRCIVDQPNPADGEDGRDRTGYVERRLPSVALDNDAAQRPRQHRSHVGAHYGNGEKAHLLRWRPFRNETRVAWIQDALHERKARRLCH